MESERNHYLSSTRPRENKGKSEGPQITQIFADAFNPRNLRTAFLEVSQFLR
jgi:hypothetical protein